MGFVCYLGGSLSQRQISGIFRGLTARCARESQCPILLPLANTGWASARPTEASAYKPGNASEPVNMEDWRRYVRKVGERYKGRIRHYEIWNEPNLPPRFTGSISKVVELTCDAYKILKSIDPQIQVVSPALSHREGKDHIRYPCGSLCPEAKSV